MKPSRLPSSFPCRKCGGTGNVGYRKAGGICFRCNGDGVDQSAYAAACAEAAIAERMARHQREKAAAEYAAACAARGTTPADEWFDAFLAGEPPPNSI